MCYNDAGPFTPEGVKPSEGDILTRDKPVRPCWKVPLCGAAGSWLLSTVRNGLSEALLKIHMGL